VDEDVLHYSITTLFVVCTGSIAFMVDDLGMILSIVGATGSTIVSYILPGASYFLLFPDRASRWVGFGLLCIGLAIMPLSLGLIIQKIMSGAPLTPH
jgi:amino acid permease